MDPQRGLVVKTKCVGNRIWFELMCVATYMISIYNFESPSLAMFFNASLFMLTTAISRTILSTCCDQI